MVIRKAITTGGMGMPGGGGGGTPVAPNPFTIESITAAWSGEVLTVSVQATAPSPIGTTVGGHVYVEDPDQSLTTGLNLTGATPLDGTSLLQGNWNPEDYGQFPFDANQQPWQFTIAEAIPGTSIRVYVQAYSANSDPAPVEYGQTGATPSATFTVPPFVAKVGSGVEYEPLAAGITADYPLKSGSTLTDQNVTGKLETPVAVYVDLSNFAGGVPRRYVFSIIGVWDNDPQANLITFAGPLTAADLGQSGMVALSSPDVVTVPHSFLIDTPKTVMGLTLFVLSGMAISPVSSGRGTNPTTSLATRPPAAGVNTTTYRWNSIVPGVTPSAHIQVGTTAGTVDLGSALVGSFSDEFYLLDGVWTMRNVDMTKATGLSSQFAIVGDLQTITNLSANLIITGELQIGGGGQHMSLIKQFDALTGAVLTGLIGDDRQSPSNPSGSGFYGAWFKGPFGVGGTPAQPAFGADSNGNAYFHNVQISGLLIVGPVSSANVAGTANSAASLSGTISCAQLEANTVAAQISLSAPQIIGGSIVGTSLTINTGSSLLTLTPSVGFQVQGGGIVTQLSSVYNPTFSLYAGLYTYNTAAQFAIVAPTTFNFGSLVSSKRGLFGIDGFGNPILTMMNTNFTDQAVIQWAGGYPQLTFNQQNVVRVRQTGPGNPSFSTLADAQAWCQNLYNALNPAGHGLLT